MKCYYRVGEDWVKGELFSTRGGMEICFSKYGKDKLEQDFSLHNSEILFNNSGIIVTGYLPIVPENLYELVSVEVRFTFPKKKWVKI